MESGEGGAAGNGTDKPVSREGVERQAERTDMWTQSREGEGGTDWESRIDIHTLPSVNRQLVGACCAAQETQLTAL